MHIFTLRVLNKSLPVYEQSTKQQQKTPICFARQLYTHISLIIMYQSFFLIIPRADSGFFFVVVFFIKLSQPKSSEKGGKG